MRPVSPFTFPGRFQTQRCISAVGTPLFSSGPPLFPRYSIYFPRILPATPGPACLPGSHLLPGNPTYFSRKLSCFPRTPPCSSRTLAASPGFSLSETLGLGPSSQPGTLFPTKAPFVSGGLTVDPTAGRLTLSEPVHLGCPEESPSTLPVLCLPSACPSCR